MDRYHLAWLMVGKPKGIVRGRPMAADEEAAYVREVAGQKTAALRMSLDAVERQGMPFRGETGGIGPGQGMGAVPGARSKAIRTRRAVPGGDRYPGEADRSRSVTRTPPRAPGAPSRSTPSSRPAWTRPAGSPSSMRGTISRGLPVRSGFSAERSASCPEGHGSRGPVCRALA